MNKVVEMVLELLVNQINWLFKWANNEIDESETIWDNYALDIVCYATSHKIMQEKLRELVAKSETKIDDKILDKWFEFVADYDEGDEEAMREAAKSLGFVGLVK